MIVGAYQLDLYCDHYVDFDDVHSYREFPYTYTGTNERVCRRDAKADGWVIKGEKALCPKCAKGEAS